MRKVISALVVSLALGAGSAHGQGIAERLQAFNASLSATPCTTDADCEARALAHGLDPELLQSIVDCENGDDDACEAVDDAMQAECDETNAA